MADLELLSKRLIEVRKQHGYTRKQLAEELGKPYRTITNYETGEHEPGHKYLIEIAKKFGVTVDYLVGRSDNPEPTQKKAPSLSDEAMKLAEDYDGRMDDRGRETVRGVADLEVARFKSETAATLRKSRERSEAAEEIAPETTEMLVYINPAAAGTPLYAESDFERMTFPSDKVPRGTDFGIRISGKSMEPTVMDGSIAWVRKRLDMPNGTVGIFMLNDSAVCKRFFKEPDGTVRLESDNPAFPDVTVAEFDALVTVGEVVGMV